MSKHPTKSLEPTTAPTSARPDRDPLTPFGHEMLALFAGPLADVRFPDLDRSTLQASADEAVRAQLEVESMERALDDARSRAREASAAFVSATTRALAYARVFATGQPALEAVLATSPVLASSTPTHPRDARDGKTEGEKKRRGRPRKDASTAELLPMGAARATANGSEESAEPVEDDEESIAAA